MLLYLIQMWILPVLNSTGENAVSTLGCLCPLHLSAWLPPSPNAPHPLLCTVSSVCIWDCDEFRLTQTLQATWNALPPCPVGRQGPLTHLSATHEWRWQDGQCHWTWMQAHNDVSPSRSMVACIRPSPDLDMTSAQLPSSVISPVRVLSIVPPICIRELITFRPPTWCHAHHRNNHCIMD